MTFSAPIPFAEAVAYMLEKALFPTTMGSAQLRRLEAQVRRRAVFSARMTRLEVLARIKRDVTSIVSGVRDSELGIHISIPEAKARLREQLEEIGWETKPEDRDTIKDFYSDERRQLIVETNVLDTLGAGRHIAETSPVSLDVSPGWELVRVAPRATERNWKARWTAAGDEVAWDGALPHENAKGRMVALKTSPIWQALGNGAGGYTDSLGNPWEPFAFRSGMGRLQLLRRECETLGLLTTGQTLAPEQSEVDLNANVSAGLKSFDAELMAVFANDPLLKAERDRLRLRTANARPVIKQMLSALGELKEAA